MPKQEEPIGELLIQSLNDAIAYERGEISAVTRVRGVRDVQVPAPPAFDQARIRSVRCQLRLSQPVFAAALGVSERTVAAWERGSRVPDGCARRLLEIVETHPETILEKVSV